MTHAPIYRLPVSLTGFGADIDNCDDIVIESPIDMDEPMSPGCVERYITTDGALIDCSIDATDFGEYYQEELRELGDDDDDDPTDDPDGETVRIDLVVGNEIRECGHCDLEDEFFIMVRGARNYGHDCHPAEYDFECPQCGSESCGEADQCDFCGEVVASDDMTLTRDKKIICRACLSKEMMDICPTCRKATYSWMIQGQMCIECRFDMIDKEITDINKALGR